MENFFVFTAVHEERFRTEHFGNLGEDGRSAFGDEKVGKNADGGIGGDARQAVGTAAFHADNQFTAGDGFALCRAGVVGQLLYQGEAVRDFVLRILGDKKFDAVRVVGADVFFNSSMLLFSQPRPRTRTPPALGWLTRSARICRVFS